MRRWLPLIALLAVSACGYGRESSNDAAPAGAAAAQPAAGASRPRIVALGDSLTAGLGLPESEAYPALLQQQDRRGRLRLRSRERRRIGRYVGRRTAAAGLGARRRREVLIRRAGRERRRCVGCPSTEMRRNLEADHRAERSEREHHGPPRRHGGAAELRCRVHASASDRLSSDLARASTILFVPFLLDGCGGRSSTYNQSRRHPSQRAGRAARGRHCSGRALQAHARPDGGLRMIELRGVSKTVPSGAGTLTILHPLDLTVRVGECRRDQRSVRAAASPRCSA